jgi:hypothetical protein
VSASGVRQGVRLGRTDRQLRLYPVRNDIHVQGASRALARRAARRRRSSKRQPPAAMPIDAEHYRKLERLYAYARSHNGTVRRFASMTARRKSRSRFVRSFITRRTRFMGPSISARWTTPHSLRPTRGSATRVRSDGFVLRPLPAPVKDGVLVAEAASWAGRTPFTANHTCSMGRNVARTGHWRVHTQLHPARPNCRLRVAQFGMTTTPMPKKLRKRSMSAGDATRL